MAQQKLFTRKIETQLQNQFPLGSSLEQNVIVRIFHPFSSWEWYVMNQDPNDPNYLWGIVKGFEVEMGSFLKSDLENLRVKGLPFERDVVFEEISAKHIWEKLRESNF